MTYRFAELSDVKLYFDWANDPEVRKNAHDTEPIIWENHVKWFNARINSDTCMLIFFDGYNPVGQLRLDNGDIDISVDAKYRGRGISTEMLSVIKKLQRKNMNAIKGEVKQTNIASIKAFEKAGFKLNSVENIKGVDCNVFII